MPDDFLIHSSTYGHLGCFLVLTTVNSAIMNFGMNFCMAQSHTTLSCMTGSGIVGLYGSSIPSFKGITTLFSVVAVPVYIPTNSVRTNPDFATEELV